MIKSHFLCFLKIHKHLNVISKIKLRFFWHLTVNLIFVSYIQNIHTYKHIDHLYKYVHTCTYLHRYFEVSSQPFHLKKDKELHVHASDFHSHELSSCSALQCVAVRCSALQCVAVRCSALQFALQCIAVRCSVLNEPNFHSHDQFESHLLGNGLYIFLQPIAERVAQNLEITSKTFSTNQNSARGIYD